MNTRLRPALRALASLLTTLGSLLVTTPGRPAEIGPEADWCAAIDGLTPPDELVLRPGEYRGPCTIRRGGTPEAPLIVRAKDPKNPPRLVYAGRESNVLNIRASHVTIRGLQFGPTHTDVDGVRIYEGSDITIEECRFAELAGIAVVANHSSIRRLTVRRNEIVRSRATAIYLGCHDGTACEATDLVVEQNYIEDVQAPDGLVGYGVQFKLNSAGVIRDNVIVRTKGPGIMVYGATDPDAVSVVERNLVSGSRNSSAIVVGGGPAIVRNNVAIRSAEAGIALQDYRQRGLLRRIVVAHNTVYGNAQGGITVPSEGPLEARIINNAVHALPGVTAFPPQRAGILSLGNVDCTRVPCFVRPESWDFSPLALKPGLLLGEGWTPADDYFGRRRGIPPTAGAIDRPTGPIPLGIKPWPR